MKNIRISIIALCILLVISPFFSQAQIIGWNPAPLTGGTNNFGPSPWTPTTIDANLAFTGGTSGLIRGTTLTISGSGATSCYGAGGGFSSTSPASGEATSFYFQFTVNSGYTVSLTTLSGFTRKSASGPTGCDIHYSVGGAAYVLAGTWTTSATSGTTGTAGSTTLSGISALQNVAAGTVIKIRITPTGATAGSWYFTNTSLALAGTVAPICSGTPNQGTVAVGTPTICSGATTTLTLGSSTTGSGITYKWQQSANGTTWSDVSTGTGFTALTYTTPALSTSTFYRCQTTCANSATTVTSTNSPSVTVVPNPSAGTITGGSSVCVGSTLSLNTTGLTGGTWTPTTASGAATIGGSTGIVTGVSAGTKTFTYTAPVVCGSAATLTVTVNALPAVGSIYPTTPGVQIGSSVSLYNPTATGTATWSTVNGTGSVTINSSNGVATGVTQGTATISYGATSAAGCGPVYTTRTIYINGLAPTIASISPLSGIPGSTVVISGTNFDPATSIVYFGATKATINTGSSTTLSLSVTVPAGALYGPVSVTSANNYTAYSPTPFTPVYNNSGFVSNTLNFNNALILTSGATPYSGAIGDLNNDGKPDLVVNNSATVVGSGSPSISIFKNVMTGTGIISGSSFSLTSTITTSILTYTPNNVKLADIDGDGRLDIIVPLPDAAYVLVYLNTTSGVGANPTFAAPVSVTAAGYTSVAAIRDFDGDGKPDLALSGFAVSNYIIILPNTSTVGSVSFGSAIVVPAGAAPSSVCIADFDNDGLPDVACPNSGFNSGTGTYSGSTITVAKNTSTYGSISFGTSVSLTVGSGPLDVAAGDINNDGKSDLLVTNANSGNISIFINAGVTGTITASSFASAVNFSSGSGSGSTPTGIAVADMNGDGKLDVVVSNNADNTVSIFRNLATGSTVTLSLAGPQNIATGNKPVTVTIGDLDADGYPDIVTGNRGGATAATTNTITILKNYPKPPIGTTSGTTTICPGSTTTFSNTVSGGGWALSNTTKATITSAGVVTGIAAGIDTVIYYTLFGGDSSIVYTPITISTLPSPGLSGTATISSGASTTLTFTGTSGDVVYYWNGGSTANTTIDGTGTSAVVVSPTSTTTYSVTSATNTFGCSQSITGVNVTITISAIADTTPTRDDNMAMGNPSSATYSMSDSNNYLMVKPQFALSYNNSKGEANWVSWHLSRAWKGSAARCDCFTSDATLPSGYFTATTSNYTGTGFDRGHLCPSDDRDVSDTDNAVTFKMTNITPQAPNMNQITWGSLESYCRSLIYSGNELYIIAGGYGSGGSGSSGGTTTTIAGTSITVPSRFFKVIVVLPVGSNDVSRVSTATRVIAVDMPNSQSVNAHPWTYYRTSVDAIEAATSYDFLSNVPTGIQAVIEAGIDNGPSNILAWDFNGANSDTLNVAAATSVGINLDTTVTYNKLSRGATATASTGANSFRTTGFSNNGISTSNTDYFETKIKAASGYQLSLTSIDATFAGTSTYCVSPGVNSQFAYSLDGTTFTLIGSPTTNIGTPAVMTSVNLSGITALQNVSSTTPIYLRYYASGQTTTGGWGFFSQYVGNYGLSIAGTTQLEPCSTAPTAVTATLSSGAVCSGSSISLTGAVTSVGATTYTWSGPNGFTATDLSPAAFTTSTASAGVYTLVAANSCGSTTATTSPLTINTAPTAVTATPSSTNICSGSTLTLTGAATSPISATYSWTGPDGFASTLLSPSITTNANSAGIYSMVATNTCGSASASSAAVAITVGTPTVAAITGSNTVLAGNQITLANATPAGTWTSLNTSIATINSSGVVTGVAAGVDTITYALTNTCGTNAVSYTITVTPAPVMLAAWDLTGVSSPATQAATIFNSGIISASGANNLTRGASATLSSGSNSFRTQGFQNNGISTSNTDYFQITLTPSSGNFMSLNTIDAKFAGTSSFYASPGVTSQFAYSLDGSTFTLIGSPAVITSTNLASSPTITLSGISALQNIPSGTTVTIRYYASGQTTTGGWGFNSPSSGAYGLAIGGFIGTCTTPPTTVTASASATNICSGSTLTLTGAATMASSYTWSGPNGFTSSLLNPAAITTGTASAGIYTLVASNNCGSTTATTTAISVITQPTAVTASVTPTSLCSGGTITLTGTATGATSFSWSGPGSYSSTMLNPAAIANATISGTYTLAAVNTCGTVTATAGITILPLPAPSISGTASITYGSGTTLTFTGTSGDIVYYSWTGGGNANTTIGGTGSATVTVSPTLTTTYTIDSARSVAGCFATVSGASATITVGPPCISAPTSVVASLSSATICTGNNVTLSGSASSSGPTTYSWSGPGGYSSTNINPPSFTGVAGIYTLIATNLCGTTTATTPALIVNTVPSGLSATPSSTSVCSGTGITLTGSASGATGYTWNGPGGFTSTLNPATATITTAGSFTMTASNTCGTSTLTTTPITIIATPTVAAVTTTTTSVVIGNTISLTDATPSGTWSVSNNAIASVSGSGVVSGIAAGIDTVSYTVTNACGSNVAKQVIVVTPAPSLIVGWDFSSMPGGTNNFGTSPLTPTTIASNVVVPQALTRGTGISTTGSGAARGWGGVDWQNTSVANAITGNDYVSFTMKANSGYAINLSSCTIAYRRSGTGPGNGELQYSIDGTSFSTVVALSYPTTSTGGNTISGINLSSIAALQNVPSSTTVTFRIVNYGGTAAGGTWYLFDVANTTAEDFFIQGSVVCSGTPAAGTVTVTGTPTFCNSGATSLTFTPGISSTGISYQWNSGNDISSFTPIAGATSTSYVTPTLTDTTYYNVATTCSYSSLTANTTNATVTVNPLPVTPAAITGTTTLCAGNTTTLTDITPGGTWTSANTAIATVNATGVVTAVSSGTTTISYTISTPSCGSASATTTLTVNPLPSAGTVVGPVNVCVGTSSPFTNSATGGTWSVSDPAVATVDASGNVYGVASGSVIISYTNSNVCGTAYDTMMIAVNTSASAGVISGTTNICPGTSATLSDGIPGGTWSSLNNSIATINSSGVVTGVTSDTVTIAYTVTTSCGTAVASTLVTVNPILTAPPAITGTSSVCPGNNTTLSDAVAGGTWSSSNTAIATVNGTGIVAGIASGSAVITYTISNLCGSAYITTPFTVNPLPAVGAISGSATVCNGSTTSLSDTTTGGTWTSASPAIASVNASTGIVSGLSLGNAVISYAVTNSCGTTTVTRNISVIITPVLSTITGASIVYTGASTTLSDTASGGTWTSGNSLIASVAANGVVSGVSLGSTIITYTVTNSCGTATATAPITVLTPTSAATAFWNFTAGSGATSPAASSTSPQVPAANCIASIGNINGTVTAISSSSPSTTLSGYSGGNNIGNAAFIGSLTSTSSYIQFTLTPNTGYFLNISGLSFAYRGTTTGPQAYTIKTSVDGYSSTVATGSLSNTSTWLTATPTFVSSITGGASTSVTVRVYGHSGSGSAGANTINWRMDDVNINFTANQNICSGSPASGTASITGASAFCGSGSTSLSFTPGVNALGTTYQWAENTAATGTFTPIAGATSTTYTTPTLTDTGYYVVTTTCNYSGISSNTGVNQININANPSIGLSAAMPNVCQPTTLSSVSFSSSAGSPTNYSIDWDATANSAGFTDVTGATLTGTSIPLTMPASGAVGTFNGSLTVTNGICTSAPYTVTTTILAHPTAAVTSLDVPCIGHTGSVLITGVPSDAISYMVDSGTVINTTLSAGGTLNISTGVITTPHNYSILSVANAVCTTYVDTTVYVIPTPMQWIGGAAGHTTDWNYANNWTCNTVPTISDNVFIDSGSYVPTITGTTPFTTGDLNMAHGASIIIDAGATLNVKGTFNNNGKLSGDGKVVLNNTTLQTIKGRGTVSNLELNNTGGAVIDTGSRMVVAGALSITAGTLTTHDSLELASTDTFSTARIAALPSSGAAISGKVKMDQYVMGGYRRYRFVAHPFKDTISLSQLQNYIDITGPGGATNGFRSTGSNAPSAFRLDPYTSNSSVGYDPGWKPFTKINGSAADSNKVHPGQGIRLFFRGAKGEGLGYGASGGGYTPSSTVFKMAGNINQGNVSIALQQGSDTAHQSFNMLGNPYPSPVDMGSVIWRAREAGRVTGAAFYIFDPAIGNGGNFVTVGLGLPSTSGGSAISYYVQANTCIQVRAASNGALIDFTEADKSANTSNYLYKAPVSYTSLAVYDEHYHVWDRLQFDFNDKATDNEDRLQDAAKPMGIADFNFYSTSADNRKLAIDSRPFAADKVIPLGITSNYQQNFIIRADNIVVPDGGKLVLHDKLLERYVDLNAGTEYAFTISKDKATQGDNRFELSLKPARTVVDNGLHVTMIPNPATDDVTINFTTGSQQQVSVRVTDISGVSVYSKDLGVLQSGKVNISLNSLAAGIYMVELKAGDKKAVHRLVKE